MQRVLRSAIVLCILISFMGVAAADEARLLRFPDVSADHVAFVYAGDIYLAPRSGGQAVQLTSHKGLELFPKFSPDGKTIAFTGEYDGDISVYIMPVSGGEPKRLTYHPAIQNIAERMGPDNIVMDWHPDGDRVLFRSRKEAPDAWFGRAYLVDTAGGLPEALPMYEAGFTSLSPDADKVAYCPIFRDFRTWKRYKGGMAQDVWIFDLESFENEKITDWIGTDNQPMWFQDRIYFNSDRSETMTLNLHCYDIETGETRQVTQFTDYDVRWPSLGPDGIVFENAGFLYVMDLPSETVRKVSVEMISDRLKTRPEVVNVSDMIYDFAVSPDGKRALFSARGDIFTVPANEGNTRNLTNSSGAHDKEPQWSPDGKWIAFLSDESGEDEIYLIPHDRSDKIRLTTDGHGWRRGLRWSPDSRKIAFSDKDNILFYVDIDSKEITQVDQSKRGGIYDYAWSADSRLLTYSKNLENSIRAIFVYDLDSEDIHQMTSGQANDYGPEFDPDGKYLYFLSERSFNPIFDTYEFEIVNNSITNIYLILLTEDMESPFAPESDEVEVAEEGDGENGDKQTGKNGDDDKAADEDNKVQINYDGIYDRQIAIDIPAGNYGGLSAISGGVFYVSRPMRGMTARIGDDETEVHKYVIEDEKDHVFAANVGSYELSGSREKMILSRRGGYYIVGASGTSASFDDTRVNTSSMEMDLDRRVEYNQIFHEAWRRNRDFFYDPNMHGVDWPAMRDKYEVLLPYVAHRFDLTYVISEMVSELCCSHTYVGGGDMPRVESSQVGLLGCEFDIDRGNNRIRIERILKGESWDESLHSPLTGPEIDIGEGDYLLAIDGREVTADINPYLLTVNKADRLITLTVNDRPSMDGARDVTIKPVSSETNLRYYNWVEDKRRYVDSVSGGDIGYIHIPDMGRAGLIRFMKMFYYQSRKPGLILDVRANGGGFVSHLILERLREPVKSMGINRFLEPRRIPGDAVHAHMLTLINEFSVSDGDIFPYYFRWYGLGPLMGVRTWGGIVGIGGGRRLVDGGYNYVPGGTQYSLEGEWVMENHGVEPDIEIDNPLDREARGYDDQLIEAVRYIQNKLEEDPMTLPPYPGPPEER